MKGAITYERLRRRALSTLRCSGHIVRRAGDFGSNMYVELYGSNLSTTTRTWAGSDFNGPNATDYARRSERQSEWQNRICVLHQPEPDQHQYAGGYSHWASADSGA